MKINEAYRLSAWEEAIGQLKEVQHLEGYALAEIGPITIIIPEEIGDRLNSFAGQRVGVLRTESDYRMRVITPSKQDVSSRAIGMAQAVLFKL